MDFKPGDTILFKRGEIWREQLIVPSSGTEGNPITFGAYGEGEKPKITGADIVTNWEGPDENGVWKISGDARQYRILLEDGQKLQKISPSDGSDLSPGQWGGTSSYIYYKPSSGTPEEHTVELGTRKRSLYINGKSYIKAENLRFEVGNAFEPPHDPDPLYLRGVVVLQNSHSCEISNCEVSYGGYLGISLNDCTDCVIKSNELTYIEDRAINIGADCSDITVASNHIHHIGKKASIRNGYNGEDKEGIAISSHGSEGSQEPFNITVEHNEIHDVGSEFSDKSTRAKGIVVCSGGADSGNITDIVIRYNKIYNCDGRGVSLEQTDGNLKFYYNIVFNNGIGSNESSVQWGGLIIYPRSGATSSVEVYNNVIWKNNGAGTGSRANVNISTGSDSTLSLFLKNNIIGLFQNSEGFDLYYYPRNGTLNFESDYNLFYEDSGDKNCISYYSEYDFDHVLGDEAGYYSHDHSQDVHSKTQDPSFVDADNGDFRLKVGSPCIDAGTDVSLDRDFNYNPVPWGAGVDIGAFELIRRVTVLSLSHNSLNCRLNKWADLSRFGNYGTPYGGAKPVMITPNLWGFKFNGSSAYIKGTTITGLNDVATILLWLMVKDADSNQVILNNIESSNIRHAISIGSEALAVGFYNGTSYTSKSGLINANKWHYIAYTWDGSNANLYLDLVSQTGTATPLSASTTGLYIGCQSDKANFLNGIIASLSIYDWKLNMNQIREHYYRSPIYRMLRGLPRSWIYMKVPWK